MKSKNTSDQESGSLSVGGGFLQRYNAIVNQSAMSKKLQLTFLRFVHCECKDDI